MARTSPRMAQSSMKPITRDIAIALLTLFSPILLVTAQPVTPDSSISLFECDPSTTWPDGGRCAFSGELVTYGQTSFLSDSIPSTETSTAFAPSSPTAEKSKESSAASTNTVVPEKTDTTNTASSTEPLDTSAPADTSSLVAAQNHSPWGKWAWREHLRAWRFGGRHRGHHHHGRARPDGFNDGLPVSDSSSSSNPSTTNSSTDQATESPAPSLHSSLHSSSGSSSFSDWSNQATESWATSTAISVPSSEPGLSVTTASEKSTKIVKHTITVSPVPHGHTPGHDPVASPSNPQTGNADSTSVPVGRQGVPADGAPTADSHGCTRGSVIPADAAESFMIPSSCLKFDPLSSSEPPLEPSAIAPSSTTSSTIPAPLNTPLPPPLSSTIAPAPVPPPAQPSASGSTSLSIDGHSTWTFSADVARANGPTAISNQAPDAPRPISISSVIVSQSSTWASWSNSIDPSTALPLFSPPSSIVTQVGSNQETAISPAPLSMNTPTSSNSEIVKSVDPTAVDTQTASALMTAGPINAEQHRTTNEPVPALSSVSSSAASSSYKNAEEEWTTLHTSTTSIIWITVTVPLAKPASTAPEAQSSLTITGSTSKSVVLLDLNNLTTVTVTRTICNSH